MSDYRKVMRRHPQIKRKFEVALRVLTESGELPEFYGAHVLDNPGGNCNGHIDFDLSDGIVDVVVLYFPHKTNLAIRFVRMGTHGELFQGTQR